MNKEINYEEELMKIGISDPYFCDTSSGDRRFAIDIEGVGTGTSANADAQEALYDLLTGRDAWEELWAMPETQGKRYYDFTMTEDGEFEIEVVIWPGMQPDKLCTVLGRGATPREAIWAVIKEIKEARNEEPN